MNMNDRRRNVPHILVLAERVLFTAVMALFLLLMYLVRHLWYSIDDVIIGATGVVAPWCLVITVAAAGFLLYAAVLLLRSVRDAAGGGREEYPLRAVMLPGVALLVWGALGTMLYLETRHARGFTAHTGYVLPDPLVMSDGGRIDGAAAWTAKRRPEVLRLYQRHVYGAVPAGRVRTECRLVQSDPRALGGKALRKEIAVIISTPRGTLEMMVLLYLPGDRGGPVPAFLGMNFFGNHTVHPDPGITVTKNWVQNYRRFGIRGNRAGDASRGVRAGRWQVEKVIARGYALATVYYGDADPDYNDGFQNGVHPLFYNKGQTRPAQDEWGSISAWAWGLSRAMDCLAAESEIDAARVVVMGHSRLGKTALWAGALDRRFAAVISNESGCMGAALSRRRYGETVALINKAFPHWFCAGFTRYSNREDDLPVDQHLLVALIAPRPVYVASAKGDEWSDPEGEYLALYHAVPVYRLFGASDLPGPEMPAIGKPLRGVMGYHLRGGRHDLTAYDWDRFLDWADTHVKKR